MNVYYKNHPLKIILTLNFMKTSLQSVKTNCLLKKVLFSVAVVFAFGATLQTAYSQNGVLIAPTNGTADNSAMLEVRSTDKGILVPRVTTAQRTAILTPATGLMVYDTDLNQFWYFNGTAWATFGTSGSTTSWELTGNAGTTSSNFIGTTDNVPLNFRVKNQKAGIIDPSGPVFLGYQAGNSNTDYSNIGIGRRVLYSNTSGIGNTATGYEALFGNIDGYYNTAYGYQALFSGTGDYNTACGYGALYSNTSGWNTAIGYKALYTNTGGWENTAVGLNALRRNTLGAQNTAVGHGALSNNTTGYENTAMGYSALGNNITGHHNIAIGFGADVSATDLYNATAIGANAVVSQSNSLVLGNNANVGIGTSAPDASAVLDLSSTAGPFRGLLIPRIALTGTNDVTTISNPANSLMIYNTVSAGTSPNAIVPGFYYYDATAVKWVQFNTGAAAYDPTNLYLNTGR
jgi:trimeric autotransporter adhesin